MTPNMIPGIVDISKWNPVTEANFVEAKEHGLIAVIQKFSQGLYYDDPTLADHLFNAYDAGITMLGAYHFGDASDPKLQARHFIDKVKAEFPDGIDKVLLLLDLEQNSTNTMSVSQGEAFVQEINQLVGRYPVLYMGRFGPSGRGDGLPSIVFRNCDLMLPAYGPHQDHLEIIIPRGFKMPLTDTDGPGVLRLWQCTDGEHHGGEFPGLGKVDQSLAIGFSNEQALRDWWGK